MSILIPIYSSRLEQTYSCVTISGGAGLIGAQSPNISPNDSFPGGALTSCVFSTRTVSTLYDFRIQAVGANVGLTYFTGLVVQTTAGVYRTYRAADATYAYVGGINPIWTWGSALDPVWTLNGTYYLRIFF